jgi:hypothetical protein
VEGSCKHDNKTSYSITFWEIIEQLSDLQFLKDGLRFMELIISAPRHDRTELSRSSSVLFTSRKELPELTGWQARTLKLHMISYEFT